MLTLFRFGSVSPQSSEGRAQGMAYSVMDAGSIAEGKTGVPVTVDGLVSVA